MRHLAYALRVLSATPPLSSASMGDAAAWVQSWPPAPSASAAVATPAAAAGNATGCGGNTGCLCGNGWAGRRRWATPSTWPVLPPASGGEATRAATGPPERPTAAAEAPSLRLRACADGEAEEALQQPSRCDARQRCRATASAAGCGVCANGDTVAGVAGIVVVEATAGGATPTAVVEATAAADAEACNFGGGYWLAAGAELFATQVPKAKSLRRWPSVSNAVSSSVLTAWRAINIRKRRCCRELYWVSASGSDSSRWSDPAYAMGPPLRALPAGCLWSAGGADARPACPGRRSHSAVRAKRGAGPAGSGNSGS
mmetsp:Transcript_17522/g.53057  ORF Transcript_17522/g.53057 Transcript_17522/m.53057 type:complete len:314 (-) Transcript_17522:11-952(-)